MGVSSVTQQTFNFIDVKIYYKKQLDYKHKYYSKGWHAFYYINTVFTFGDANSKHAMLMNGIIVEISQ